MNNELKPYDEYKEAPFLWLATIPMHWKYKRAKAMYSKANRPVREIDEVVTCFRDGTVTLRKNRRTTGFTESIKEIGYQGIRKGDLVIHVMDAFAGAVGVSDSDGKGTPVYSVCVPKEDLNNYYYAYIVREMAKTGFIQSLYRGIRERSSDFRFEVFANQYMPIPPRDEQDQIVKYLDYQLAKINKFIKAKKKLIAALNEQKQAVINGAVTKGINPNVKMKPSGIEWMGDIPEHWKIVQLRRIVKTVKTGGTPQGADEKYYSDNGFNWYTPSDFSDELELKKATRQLSEVGIDCVNIFPANTILMIGIGGTMGKVSISKDECSCNQQINAIICNSDMNIEYLVMFLRAMRNHIFATAKYTTLPILNQDETKKLPVIKMLKREQDEIVDYIKSKTKVIDKNIEGIEKEIGLITEYRTSLISDVVTGKVDVRNIKLNELQNEEIEFEVVDDEIIEGEEDIEIEESGE